MKSELPPLQISKPCPKKWDDMTGDAKRRFCEHCQLHVHNLSTMSAREREKFVAEQGGHACIAYELRTDGSMIVPSRWSWLLMPFQRIKWSVAALLTATVPFFFSACSARRTLGKPAPPSDVSTHPTVGKSQPNMLLGSPLAPPREEGAGDERK